MGDLSRVRRGIRRDKLNGLLVFFVVLVSCSYFFTGGGWNQASRYNLIRAIVEHGTLQIDRYHQNTGDKAQFAGHYYSDKAPGASLLAVPFVMAANAVASPLTSSEAKKLMIGARVTMIVTSALPTALAAAAIYFIGRRLGASGGSAAAAGLGYGLGTPAWAYGTLFFGHALAAGCLIASFWAALKLLQSHWSVGRYALLFSVGLAAGWAVVTEFPAAIVAVALTIALLVRLPRTDLRAWFGAVGMLTLGALGPGLVLAMYNQLAFGSPFHLAYSSVVGWEGMQTGLFGVTLPKGDVVNQLIFGEKRGLIRHAPILLLAPVGLIALVVKPGHRFVGLFCLGTFGYYLLMNASYHYWTGGFSYGPRHLAAGLPFLCVGLTVPWARIRGGMVIVKCLLAVSIAITLVAVTVNPMVPEVDRPFQEVFWPGFLDGKVSQNGGDLFGLGATQSQNWGEAMGLRGLASLAPLLVFWLLGERAWRWIQMTPGAQ